MMPRRIAPWHPALLLVVAACATPSPWALARGPTPQAASAAMTQGRGRPIRVELKSGALFTMTDARFERDSVIGVGSAAGDSTRVAVATADIEHIEYRMRGGDADLIVLFTVVIPVLGALAMVLLFLLLGVVAQ